MSGGGQQSTSTTKFEPPDYTIPEWVNYVQHGFGLSQQPYTPYDGQMVANPSENQQNSWNMVQDRAVNGASDLNAGRGAATNVASGAFFNNSPWTSNEYTANVIRDNANTMANAAALGSKAQTDSMMALKGGYGGSAWAQQQAANNSALENQVGQMANQYQLANANMGNSNYMMGVNQMLQGGQLGGQLSQDDWQAAQMLGQAGQQQQTQQQNQLTNAYQQWQQQQNWPYVMQQFQGNILANASGNYGTNQQTANPYGSNNGLTAGLLGGGALGLGAYQSGLFG